MSHLYTHPEAVERLSITGDTAASRSRHLVARLTFLGFIEPCTRCGGTGFAKGEVWDFRCPQCDTYGVVLVPLTTEVILKAERMIADGGLKPYFERMARIGNVPRTVATLTRAWGETQVAVDSRQLRDWSEGLQAALTKDEVNRLRDELYASPRVIFDNRCAAACQQASEIEAEVMGLHWYREWDRVGLLLKQLEPLSGQVAAATAAYLRSRVSEDAPRPVFASFRYQMMPHFVRVLARTGAHTGLAEEKLAGIIPNFKPQLLLFVGFVAEAPQFQDLYPRSPCERTALIEFVEVLTESRGVLRTSVRD